MTEAAILVEDLHKRYGRGSRAVDALRGIDLAVGRGEIYGLLGRNGAGKTTLVKVLLDIARPTRGRTTLLGVSSRTVAARDAVGYLPEDHRFPDYRTAEGRLDFYGALSGMPASARRARADELLALVGLDDARKRKVRGFSKGMKQRLGLAQAMLSDPEIVFLDEPTDGVDPVGRADIRRVLEKLRAAGKTIFLNSHLLSEVEQICDRVGILEGGELVREGSIPELTHTGRIYEVELAAPAGDGLIAALGSIVTSITTTGDARSLEIAVEDDRAIDAAVDRIRADGIGLRRLVGKRTSLEDVFLSAVEERRAQDAARRSGGEEAR